MTRENLVQSPGRGVGVSDSRRLITGSVRGNAKFGIGRAEAGRCAVLDGVNGVCENAARRAVGALQGRLCLGRVRSGRCIRQRAPKSTKRALWIPHGPHFSANLVLEL